MVSILVLFFVTLKINFCSRNEFWDIWIKWNVHIFNIFTSTVSECWDRRMKGRQKEDLTGSLCNGSLCRRKQQLCGKFKLLPLLRLDVSCVSFTSELFGSASGVKIIQTSHGVLPFYNKTESIRSWKPVKTGIWQWMRMLEKLMSLFIWGLGYRYAVKHTSDKPQFTRYFFSSFHVFSL